MAVVISEASQYTYQVGDYLSTALYHHRANSHLDKGRIASFNLEIRLDTASNILDLEFHYAHSTSVSLSLNILLS